MRPQQRRRATATLAKNDSQGMLEICKARGVYVDPVLLEQFVDQLTAEQADQELSLEQLEDIAGGFGVVDTLVSGLVLAVVASNAGSFMNQVHAGTGRGGAPVASWLPTQRLLVRSTPGTWHPSGCR